MPRKGWRVRGLLILLWGLGWAGLSADPWAWRFGQSTTALLSLRAWLPILAGGTAVVWLCANAAGRLPKAGWPLAGLAWYGLLGLLSSLLVSPVPAQALYWALSYLAVLCIALGWAAAGPDATEQLLDLTWLCIGVLGAWAVMAVVLHGSRYGWSLRAVTNVMPSIFGMPMMRETGIGRNAAIIGIVALCRLARRPWSWRSVLWCGIFAVSVAIVGVSDARSAVLGLTAGMLAVGLVRAWVRGFRTPILIGLGVVAAAALAAIPYALRDVAGILSGRDALWRAGWELASDSPIIGMGFQADRVWLEWPHINHISNGLLHAAAQSGWVGAAAFAAAWVSCWRLAWQGVVRHAEASPRSLEVFGLLVLLTVRSVFESTGAFFGVDWLVLAALSAHLAAPPQPAASRPLVFVRTADGLSV